MSDLFANFHFLRPWWLLTSIPAFGVWWLLWRASDAGTGLTNQIAPHLLRRMVTRPSDRPRIRPLTTLLPFWLLLIVAVAGPAWRLQPSPFAEDQSQLTLVVNMSPSMSTADLQPSRLERVRIKLHELLELRKDAGVALICYSGSAHLVMPTTTDHSVIDHMLEALDPSVMPAEGDALAAGLDLASQQVEENGGGSILVVTDKVAPSEFSRLEAWREGHSEPVQVLAALRDEEAYQASGIPSAASVLNAASLKVTPDDRDVQAIARRSSQSFVAASNEDATQWRDDGYLLVPVLGIILLLWSRRGWNIPSAG